MTVIGYARVSTEEQHDSGAGLPAQVSQLEAEASRRGWALEIVTESGGRSGSSLRKREALATALERLDSGEAKALVVTKLDRLTRSLADYARLQDRANSKGWDLVILDLGIDTSTPSGALMAGMMASVAQFERSMIAQRTREGLAQRKAQGVRLGRPVTMDSTVRDLILRLHGDGMSLRGIAQHLVDLGVETAHGGATWHASTVSRAIKTAYEDEAHDLRVRQLAKRMETVDSVTAEIRENLRASEAVPAMAGR